MSGEMDDVERVLDGDDDAVVMADGGRSPDDQRELSDIVGEGMRYLARNPKSKAYDAVSLLAAASSAGYATNNITGYDELDQAMAAFQAGMALTLTYLGRQAQREYDKEQYGGA